MRKVCCGGVGLQAWRLLCGAWWHLLDGVGSRHLFHDISMIVLGSWHGAYTEEELMNSFLFRPSNAVMVLSPRCALERRVNRQIQVKGGVASMAAGYPKLIAQNSAQRKPVLQSSNCRCPSKRPPAPVSQIRARRNPYRTVCPVPAALFLPWSAISSSFPPAGATTPLTVYAEDLVFPLH